MLRMKCHISIEGRSKPLTQVHSVRIETSIDMLTDTCEITLPSAIEGRARELEAGIKVGKRVFVEIGYEGYPPVEWSGYVSRTSPEHPFRIECEDASWLMKQVVLNKSWRPREATLALVVGECVRETNRRFPDDQITIDDDLPEVRFDNFRLVNVNAAQAIEKLKEEFGLTSYFVPNSRRLYSGLQFTANRGRVVYDLNRNVISHSLTYRNEDDVPIQVHCIGITKENKRVEVFSPTDRELKERGITNADKRTIFKYNVTSKAALECIADKERSELSYTGFEGSLTGFLIPRVVHGMTAVIRDEKYPERAGAYHVDKVVSTFSSGGGRNEVFLGKKLGDE